MVPKNHLIVEADELDAEAAARRGADLGEFYAMMGFPYQGMWFGGVELLWRTVVHRDENGTMINNDDGPQGHAAGVESRPDPLAAPQPAPTVHPSEYIE